MGIQRSFEGSLIPGFHLKSSQYDKLLPVPYFSLSSLDLTLAHQNLALLLCFQEELNHHPVSHHRLH